MEVRVDGPQRPAFSYAYQVIDDAKGDNGDGLIQRGESVRLHVTVKNIGHGKSNETLAQLRNLSDEGVFINKGRFNVDNLAAGRLQERRLHVRRAARVSRRHVKVEMTVYDAILHEFVTDKLSFPVVDAKSVGAASGKVAVTTPKADIRGGASKDAPLVGIADKGAAFELTGDAGEFWRVKLAENLPGFIAKTATHEATGATKVAAFTPAWQVEPPTLTVQAGAPLVDTGTIHVTGVARADHKVSDMFIFVSNRTAKIDRRKVFYQSNRKATNPREEQLNIDVPLWPGANVVTVVARESQSVQSQETLIVQRREPRVATETHAKPEQPIEPGKRDSASARKVAAPRSALVELQPVLRQTLPQNFDRLQTPGIGVAQHQYQLDIGRAHQVQGHAARRALDAQLLDRAIGQRLGAHVDRDLVALGAIAGAGERARQPRHERAAGTEREQERRAQRHVRMAHDREPGDVSERRRRHQRHHHLLARDAAQPQLHRRTHAIHRRRRVLLGAHGSRSPLVGALSLALLGCVSASLGSGPRLRSLRSKKAYIEVLAPTSGTVT